MTATFPIERAAQIQLIVCPAVFSTLALVAVFLRVLARRLARRCLDASDWLIVAACVRAF